MTWFRALCFCLLLFPVTAVWANAPEPILLVTESEPPLQYEQDGEIQGVAASVIKEMFRRAKLTPEIQELPWARAYRQASQQANVGIFSIARIPQRESSFHWIGPIVPYRWGVFRLKSRADIELQNLTDLHRFQVGVVLGDVAHHYLLSKGFRAFPEGNLNTSATAEIVLNKLRAGRVELMLMSELSCQTPERHCQHFARALELPEMGNGLYLAFRKDSDPKLMHALEAAFATMVKDGTLNQLQQALPSSP